MQPKEIRTRARKLAISLDLDRKAGIPMDVRDAISLAQLIRELADYLTPKTVRR